VLPGKGGELASAGGLGIEHVCLAVLGPVQGVVEDADEVVVLVACSGGLLSGVHSRSSWWLGLPSFAYPSCNPRKQAIDFIPCPLMPDISKTAQGLRKEP
jgi:hypothetical protein